MRAAPTLQCAPWVPAGARAGGLQQPLLALRSPRREQPQSPVTKGNILELFLPYKIEEIALVLAVWYMSQDGSQGRKVPGGEVR